MFKTADYLTLRAPDQSVMQKLPAAKEAKQRLPPRNHCRPVLKGAPFIVCSGCFKLVQVSADFAVFTKKVHELRCGSCSAVLSYAYRVPARKKPYQKSIDQLRSIADAALLLLEVLGARRRELGRSSNSWLETGTLFGGFHEPKTWTKYLMKNVVTRQGLDTYTWSFTSTLTEEDSFDPHKYSYRQVRVSGIKVSVYLFGSRKNLVH
ncbi:hypothetical protein PAHAL_7G123700 [Panicum hallii]|uniref:Probable zinc-ribbon domain-containing protein n=1 Tax=Panicum hallii TaxID=206008 RepID=A0A2T8IC26_9POAL|nr:hypothetical protein PAHAL_7G123700 [Panicum hallii]